MIDNNSEVTPSTPATPPVTQQQQQPQVAPQQQQQPPSEQTQQAQPAQQGQQQPSGFGFNPNLVHEAALRSGNVGNFRSGIPAIRNHMDSKNQTAAENPEAQSPNNRPKTSKDQDEVFKPEDYVEYTPEQYREVEGYQPQKYLIGGLSDRNAAASQISESITEMQKDSLVRDRFNLRLEKDPELRKQFPKPEEASLRDMMEAVGDDYQAWFDHQWTSRGLAPPSAVGDAPAEKGAKTYIGKAHERQQQIEAAKRQEEYLSSIGTLDAPEGYFERLRDYYFSPFGGTDLETGARKRLASQAVSEAHLEVLVQNELARYAEYGERRKAGTNLAGAIDPSKMEVDHWSLQLVENAARGFHEAAMGTIDAYLAGGAALASAGGNIVGFDNQAQNDWLFDWKRNSAIDEYNKLELTHRYEMSAGDGFIARTAWEGSHVVGALMFDSLATAFLGGVPVFPALKAASTGTARFSGRLAANIFEDTFGRVAFQRAANLASKAKSGVTGAIETGIARIPGRPIPTSVHPAARAFFGKTVTAPNTFLTRVAGDSFANSYSRQMERAEQEGREVNAGDLFVAMRDSMSHTAIATLIGRNIPGIKRFPAGSRGLSNSGPFDAGTMAAALDRAMGRTLVQGVRGGKDFVMFDILMDAYSMVDSEDRAETLHKWMDTDERLQDLFGSFLIGGVVGFGHLSQNIRLEVGRGKAFNSGREAWKEWTNLSPTERRELLDTRIQEFRDGMREQMQLELQVAKENPELLKEIPDAALAEMLFYGTNSLPDLALVSGDAPLEARFYINPRDIVSNTEGAARLIDSTGRIPVTRAMAIAEAQRRGRYADVAQFADGRVDFLFEGRDAIQARRAKYADTLSKRREQVLAQKESQPNRNQVLKTAQSLPNIESVYRETSGGEFMLAPGEIAETLAERGEKLTWTSALKEIIRDTRKYFSGKDYSGKDSGRPRMTDRQLASRVLRDARLSGNPELARQARDWANGKGPQTEGVKRLLKNVYLREKFREERDPFWDTDHSALLHNTADRIRRDNPNFARYLLNKVAQHQNDVSNPAISRQMFAKLFGENQPTSKRFRKELGDLLAASLSASSNTATIEANNRKVKAPSLKSEGRDSAQVVRVDPAQKLLDGAYAEVYGPPTRAEYVRGRLDKLARDRGQSTDLDPTVAESTETRQEASERGVSDFQLNRQSPDVPSKPQPGQQLEGIDRELERLEKTTQENDPVEIAESLIKREEALNPLFPESSGIPADLKQQRNREAATKELRQRLIRAVRYAKGFLRASDVEIPYEGIESSSLMNGVRSIAEKLGMQTIVVAPTETAVKDGTKRFRRSVNFVGDVAIVNAGTSITHARAEIVRHSLVNRLLKPQFKKLMQNWYQTDFLNFDRIGRIYYAATGEQVSPAQLSNAFKKANPYDQAKFFLDIFPHLTREERRQLIRYEPAAISLFTENAIGAFKEAGFNLDKTDLEKSGSVNDRMISNLIDQFVQLAETGDFGGNELLRKDGSLRAKHIRILNDAIDVIFTLGGNPHYAATAARLALLEAGKPISDPTRVATDQAKAERTKTEQVEETVQRPSPPVEIINENGLNESALLEMERHNPGLLAKLDALDGHPLWGKGVPIVFDHNGTVYELNPGIVTDKNGQYLGPKTTIRVQKEGEVDTRGDSAIRDMTPEQAETAEQIAHLVEKGKESTTVDASEVAPEVTRDGKPGQVLENPAAGETSFENRDPGRAEKSLMRRVFDPFQATILKYFQDPLNAAIQSGVDLFKKAVSGMYLIEQSNNDAMARDLFNLRKAERELAKSGSSLMTDEGGARLARILEEKILPEEIDVHPTTAGLSKAEKAYIRNWKDLFERQRVDMRDDRRRAVEMRYKYGTIKQNVERIREDNPDWVVTAEKDKDTKKQIIKIKTPTETVELNRETLPEWIANETVRDDWGNPYSYVPHMFFGRYKGQIEIVDAEGNRVGSPIKFGVGERTKRDLEYGEILDYAKMVLEREASMREGVSYRIKVSEAGGVVPQDTVYMPRRVRGKLVDSIAKHTDSHRNEVNRALNGRVTSQNVATPFLASMLHREGAENYSTDIQRIGELAIQNYYRNKLGRRVQQEINPLIEKMREDASVADWIPDYTADLANHVVFGTRGFERVLAKTGSEGFVRAWDKTLGNVRAAQFYRQLFRPGQHVINTTQQFQVWSLLGTAGYADAVRAYNSKEGKEFLEQFGFFDANGYNPGKFGDSLSAGAAAPLAFVHSIGNRATGRFWNWNSEARNQNFSQFALAKHARENLNMSPEEAANYGRIWGSLFTQYRFSRANDPVFLRGNIGKTLGQFKRFQIQTLGASMSLAMNMSRPGAVDGIGRSAFTRFMILNAIMGGVRGSLLGFGLLTSGALGAGAYAAIRQMFDDEYLPSLPKNPFSSEAAAYQWLNENVDQRVFGVPVAEVVMYGSSRLLGLDLSGTFNLTNTGPGGLGMYFLGPNIGMLARTYQDAFAQRDSLARPSSVRMLESLWESGAATRSGKALIEYVMFCDTLSNLDPSEYESTMLGLLSEGRRRSGSSELIQGRTHLDFAFDILGLRSANYTNQWMLSSVGKMAQETWIDARSRIAAVYAQDRDKGLEMMQNWNRAYGSIAPMNYSDIREMMKRAEKRVTLPRSARDINRLSDVAEAAQGRLLGNE
jgi:hypothetical protein